MARYFGSVKGSRGEATRLGSSKHGMTTVAATWGGAIKVEIYCDELDGRSKAIIRRVPWKGHGNAELIAHVDMGEGS